MRRRDLLSFVALAPGVAAQQSKPPAEPAEPPVEWVCPMDPDVRAPAPSICPRCKMKLVPGIPDSLEYPLRLDVTPKNWKAGDLVRMRFDILDPTTGKRVPRLLEIHEKLFHLFLVSGDLSYFAHEHPVLQPDGTFVFETRLPRPGFYRVLGDFYPAGGTPQMAVNTILSAGSSQLDFTVPALREESGTARGRNLSAALTTVPTRPLAGLKTQLHFQLSPADGLETYLGAWGHMLAASADLIDLIHTHPFIADGGPAMQFNVVFPRPGMYRLWPQFQRKGVVNTLQFTFAVSAL